MLAQFGDAVATTFLERIDPGVPARQAIEELIDEGHELIFATSFSLSAAVDGAAAVHPGVRFAQARGSHTAPNLATYSGADEETIYLAGMAAGGSTRSNRIGFVGAIPEAETIRHINAFTLGARALNPQVIVTVSWLGRWYDPATETAFAQRMVEQGADIVATGTVSTASGDVARAAGVGWVGHHNDQSDEYSREWITSAVPNWENYYVDQVRRVLDGTWVAEAYYGSLSDGFTELAPIGPRVPGKVREAVRTRHDQILRGTFDIFAGPIRDQTGTVRVPTGSDIAFADRLGMDWFVEGVSGTIPPPGRAVFTPL